MPFVEDVNRLLRDHVGYSGDGQGGTGPLPVGDRNTAQHEVAKRDLRELLIQMAQTMGDPSALATLIAQLADTASRHAIKHFTTQTPGGTGNAAILETAESQQNSPFLNGCLLSVFWPETNTAPNPTATLRGTTYLINRLNGGVVQPGDLVGNRPLLFVRYNEERLRLVTPVDAADIAGLTQALADLSAAIAAGDTAARARANHTGTQPINTIDGLPAAIDGLSQSSIDRDATEEQARVAGDAAEALARQQALTAEAAARDAAIAAAVDDEEQARVAGDAAEALARQQALTAEAAARDAAIAAAVDDEEQARVAGDAAEALARATADTQLQGQIDTKAPLTTVDRIGLADLDRPGEDKSRWSTVTTGAPEARPALTIGTVVNADYGAVLRISGADIPDDLGYIDIAPRRAYALEPTRIYMLRAAFARAVNPADPSGDSIEVRLRNLSATKAHVSNVRRGEPHSLTVADGVRTVSVLISRAADADVDYTPPATARYVTPFLRIYGVGQATDAVFVQWRDVTDAVLGGADVAALAGQMDEERQARIYGDEALSGRIDQEAITLSTLIGRSTIGLTGIMGPANAIRAVIPSQLGITDIPIGARVSLRGTGINTGPVTLSVNEGPERPVLDGKGRPLVGGELSNTTPFEARRMNETEYRIVSSLTHPADLAAEVSVLTAADEVNLTLASMPGRMAGEFHNGGENDPILAFLDDKGIALGLDDGGHLIERIAGEFHNSDDDDERDGLIFVGGGKVLSSSGEENPEIVLRLDAVEQRATSNETALSSQGSRIGSAEVVAADALALAQALQGAASSGVSVYASVAEGLAATSDGDFFAVSDGGTDYQALYQRSGANAVLRGRLQSLQNLPTSQVDAGEGRIWQGSSLVRVAQTYSAEFSMARADIVTTHQSLYARYDALMAEFPNYITMTVLGTDSLGNEMREYAFTPPPPRIRSWPEAAVLAPKIVMLGGIHGHEREALVTYYLLAQQLCHSWRTDEFLGKVRWNCRLIIVPCQNPSGIDASTRKNHSGVDLNRNFPWAWETGGETDPSSDNYRGPAPFSEAETNVIMQIPDRHGDAFAFVDHHNSSGFSHTGYLLWLGVATDRPEDVEPALQALRHMDGWSRRELSVVADEHGQITRITSVSDGTLSLWFAMAAGRRAYLLETAPAALGPLLDQRRTAYESTRVLIDRILSKAMLSNLTGD